MTSEPTTAAEASARSVHRPPDPRYLARLLAIDALEAKPLGLDLAPGRTAETPPPPVAPAPASSGLGYDATELLLGLIAGSPPGATSARSVPDGTDGG